MKRQCGILMPVFSLPSRFGIGCFDSQAYRFIDFLKESGQSMWQVLPFCQTGFGDSPYQSVSSFAGNPYFIDLEQLIGDGLLTYQECESVWFGSDRESVDYGAMYENRYPLLRKAYERFKDSISGRLHNGAAAQAKEYKAFLEREAYWLRDYSLFMSIKQREQGRSWQTWEDGLKMRDPKALQKAEEELADEMGFYFFQQYEFERHWDKLHRYAKEKGISIIGDIPFYVAMDSAAAWAHKEIFRFDKDGTPIDVAGCAPDAFSKTGQLWGNPLYDWKALKKSGYRWWINRIARNMEFYDVLRIDHFNGFAEYYAVPYGDETAENGKVMKGPGMDFFKNLNKELGDVPIIAEDLGTLTPVTEKLLEDAGYPGMKVLQYAFDWTEYSYYLPYNHIRNCVVYTGTHDNTTTRAWIEEISDHDRDLARRYIHSENTDYGTFVWDMIREAYRSVADLCIIPLQDYLVKGKEARINHPGTLGENWKWRLAPNFLSGELSRSIYQLAKLYGRIPKAEKKDDEIKK